VAATLPLSVSDTDRRLTYISPPTGTAFGRLTRMLAVVRLKRTSFSIFCATSSCQLLRQNESLRISILHFADLHFDENRADPRSSVAIINDARHIS
jgi:hypothetical protein